MQIGQHVVYIGNPDMLKRVIKPVPGKVYTIRDLWIASDGMPCLYVEEIRNRHARSRLYGSCELGYKRSSWRPLSPGRIEVFTNMLVGENEDA